jgi:hypothetical protein
MPSESMETYLRGYPSDSTPLPNTDAGNGIPSFLVRPGMTSADSTPQPDVALPSTALPNDIQAARLNGGAGYQLMGKGYEMSDSLQFRSTVDEAGTFSTELHNGDAPISTPYPSDPRTKGNT